MNEENFEKEFPSLKGKINYFKTRVVEDGKGIEKGYIAEVEGEPVINVSEKNWAYVKDIQKHCLDKQRVKEIIDKLIVKYGWTEGLAFNKLKKELKL